MYRTILPRPSGSDAAADDIEAQAQASGTVAVNRPPVDDDQGLYLGRIRITPAFHALYVRAEGALLDSAAPVADEYYEMRPTLAAAAPVGNGWLRGGYQAHIRRGSSFELVETTTTHLADVSLQAPLGGLLEITASEHFARGVLETPEVDPGREYFFGLGRFTRHRHAATVRLLSGGRADAGIGGSIDVVRVDERSSFFDHERQSASADVGYEVRPDLRAAVVYGYSRVPFTADRPQAESHEHALSGSLSGEILPLTSGNLSIGYSRHTSPRAPAGADQYRGLVLAGRLEKSFTPSTSLSLSAVRATHASGFEDNGFYVTTSGDVLLRAAAPFSTTVEAGAGYHRNDYRAVSVAIGAPRRDAIRGWSLGLGRSVTRHAFIRADYRRDRRDSNIDGFDSRSSALTVQLGVGLFDRARR